MIVPTRDLRNDELEIESSAMSISAAVSI